MSKLLMNLEGVNGQVELYEDKVIIKRQGFMAKMSQGFGKGDKTIYLSKISGIQVKYGGSFTNGYIQFVVSGSSESKGGLLDATKDENSVVFTRDFNNMVDIMKEQIEELQSKSSQHSIQAALSPADEIRKYKMLLDDGIISQEEFNQKKQELLRL